jgi:hypothetical protein
MPCTLRFWKRQRTTKFARLKKWVIDKTYLQAVKITHSAVELEGTDSIAETTETDVEIEYHPAWKTRKVYVWPHGIYVHRGNTGACGRLCRKTQSDAEDEYVDPKICVERQ